MKQITLDKVGYAYDTEWILKDSNLIIQQGDECVLLTGKNETGESTLLNVICGFLPPDHGNPSRGRMTIGYLLYEHPLYHHLTVLENLRYFYRCFHGKNLDVQDAAVQEALQALSIDCLNQHTNRYSSGREQKTGIACILLSNADMIIMDEPFIAIDAKSNEGLCELTSKECENTVFPITNHTSSGILPVVSRLLALDGRHLILGTKDHRKIMQYFQPKEDAV